MALNSFNKKLKVKVIIGPFFSKKLISNIKILSKSFAHSISLIENETNLKNILHGVTSQSLHLV